MNLIELDVSDSELENGKLYLYDTFLASMYLGISIQTLGRYRKERWLKGARVGSGFIYTKKALDACKAIHPNQEKKDQFVTYN